MALHDKSTDLYAGFTAEVDGRPPRWLYESSHVRAGVFPSAKIVVVQRSAVRLDLGELAGALEPMLEVLNGVRRDTHGLLLDSRSAPGRNDPDYEEALSEYRARIIQGWARVAVLVSTIVGQLQLQRHQREGLAAPVYNDQGRALAWLLGGR